MVQHTTGLTSQSVGDIDSQTRALGLQTYSTNCQSCHGQIDVSTKLNSTLGDLKFAINGGIPEMTSLKSLSENELEAVIFVLTPPVGSNQPGSPLSQIPWSSRKERTCSSTSVETAGALISEAQYFNIVHDVFGIDPDISKLPKSETTFYFSGDDNSPYAIRDFSHLGNLFDLAESVSKKAATDISAAAKRFVSCDPLSSDTSVAKNCQDQVITTMLSRLFRRTVVTTDETYINMNAKIGVTSSFGDRLQKTLEMALMMPQFLYHFQSDTNIRNLGPLLSPLTRDLTDSEIAERLAFMIWNSAPDQTLLDAASAGTLSQSANFDAQVDRLLSDPKSSRMTQEFGDEWLELNTLPNLTKATPGFSPALMGQFQTETRMFIQSVYASDVGYDQFFTSGQTFVDAQLAANYGIKGVTSTSFISASRPEAYLHAGILAQGSVSAISSQDSTDTIFRGLYASRHFLCISFGQPPAGAIDVVVPGDTKYDVMENRIAMQSCKGCHSIFEPLGYTLESLSPLGQSRTVDESGTPVGVRSVQVYSGDSLVTPADLGKLYASNSVTGDCLGQMLFRYGTRSNITVDDNFNCQINNVTARAFRNGNSLKAYVREIVHSPAFRKKLEVN